MPDIDDKSLQTIRSYASSLQGDERQSFIDNFNKIKDDDSKVSSLASRIGGLSQPSPDSGTQDWPGIAKAAVNTMAGISNTMTGGAMNAFEDWLSKQSGVPRPSDPNTMSYKIGQGAGYIPLGSAVEAGVGAIASKVAPQLLQKTIPMMAARGVIEGGTTGAIGTPDNRTQGALIGGAVSGIANPLLSPLKAPATDEELTSHILDSYSKAINPTISKFSNSVKANEFNTKVPVAMKSIADNSKDLKFENPVTGAMEYRLPINRAETLDALDQTKQSIYDQYNALQKSATSQGVQVDVPSIAQQAFEDIKNSRQFKLYAPDMVKDANKTMTRLLKSGSATPEEVQDDIAFLNQKMKGYYQRGEFNQANIYANYAASLRKGLDDAIEKSLNQPGYQDLKNKYAALKYVESDLSKSAGMYLKNSHKGISDAVSNPIALAEMARGIFLRNPAELATGMAIKGASTLHKAINNPDWRIATMFKNIKRIRK